MLKPLTLISTFTLLFFLFSSHVTAKQPRFYRTISPTFLGLRKEKLTHLHFYFHDTASGPNPTATVVAQAQITKNSSTLFGAVAVMDDPLTVGPEPGKYNGSTLSLFGRNAVLNSVREMPIVGGSGVFRFAHGYGEAKTHWFNITSGDAVVEYNVYVFHY
ncbi:hypothetical protein AHAS_Ahas06G0100100 [Arachis hypogaea]